MSSNLDAIADVWAPPLLRPTTEWAVVAVRLGVSAQTMWHRYHRVWITGARYNNRRLHVFVHPRSYPATQSLLAAPCYQKAMMRETRCSMDCARHSTAMSGRP
jgi:hypothetical protein